LTSPKELRRRIVTIRNIERTVDAMQKISAARLARERQALIAGRPYTDAVVALVRELAESGFSHPLLDVREDKGYMLLVVGADRGMCGAYTTNLLRAATDFIATRHREKLYLVTAGRKLRRFRPRTSALIVRETIRHPMPLAAEHEDEIALTVANAYLTGDAARVYFAYTEFHGATGNRPHVRRILPLMPPPARPVEPLFEPAPRALLNAILPRYVRAAVRAAFQEASVSEHAARMVTMEQASVNARNMISDLTLAANKLRQTTITRELLDIVGTAEALA
jgi:F-type H+-transporting ATPase subunit gamma